MEIQEIIVAIVLLLALGYLVKHAMTKEENASDPCSTCATTGRKIPGHLKPKHKEQKTE